MDPSIILILIAGVVVCVPPVVLLARSQLAVGQTARALNGHGIHTGEGSPWLQARRTGQRRATKFILILLAVIAVICAAAWIITHQIEPGATDILGAMALQVLLPAFGVLLVVVVLALIKTCEVQELHRELSANLPGDHPARDAALGKLRGVTWSQTGATGVGVAAGIVCFLFGAGLIGALFVFASAAISCARDPKCL